MIIQELQQVEVDHCCDCHGIWLDEGELEMLSADTEEILPVAFQSVETPEALKKCPICQTRMNKMRTGTIILDQCPKKHGIWFDNGELLELIQSSEHQNSKLISLLKTMFNQSL
jgi:Zn-finger nucleic acid-binding protein